MRRNTLLAVSSPVQACSACLAGHCTAACCQHARTDSIPCEPGSLACDGAVIGRFVELKDAGLEGDLVTHNTLLKACMRSANLPCARVIMRWIRERGLQVTPHPCVLGTLIPLLRPKLAWPICHLSRGACSVQKSVSTCSQGRF